MVNIIVLRLDDMRHLRESALAIYRARYGLLSSDEIRSSASDCD